MGATPLAAYKLRYLNDDVRCQQEFERSEFRSCQRDGEK
jgi:hypothetical protein